MTGDRGTEGSYATVAARTRVQKQHEVERRASSLKNEVTEASPFQRRCDVSEKLC
jgi:hypothetical protein